MLHFKTFGFARTAAVCLLKMRRTLSSIAGLILAGVFTPSTAHSVTLLNGGFEDGTYSSTVGGLTNNNVPNEWTPTTAFVQDPALNGVSAANPDGGKYALQLGNNNPSLNYINAAVSQTISDVAGATYVISFDAILVDALPGNSNELVIMGNWDGDGGASWSGWITSRNDSGATVPNVIPGAYFDYGWGFIGTGSDTITIANLGVGDWYVDDVQIQLIPQAPEPSTWAMMLLGFAGLGFAGYRRARRVSPRQHALMNQPPSISGLCKY